MFDAYEQQRKAALREMSENADNSIDAQRRQAIKALGERWVCHPSKAPRKALYNPVTGKYLGEAT